ncbi:ATP-dependent DNA ligase, partial [Streptomyces cadmiisoli]
MTWTPPEPMLASLVPSPNLPPQHAAEPKWDGFRALLSVDAEQVLLRSRRGTDLAPAFPDIVSASRLPDDTAADGEPVVWEAGRLAVERLYAPPRYGCCPRADHGFGSAYNHRPPPWVSSSPVTDHRRRRMFTRSTVRLALATATA